MHHLLIGGSSFLTRRDGQIVSGRIIRKFCLFCVFLASFVMILRRSSADANGHRPQTLPILAQPLGLRSRRF